MQAHECIFILYLVASFMVLQSTALTSGNNDGTDDLYVAINETLRTDTLEPDHKLSRKRRYLEFPEGSSFQLVLDLVVAVVDNVNYITVSITVAMAWELPSKPPSELLEDLKDRLKDGIGQPPRRPSADVNEPLKSGTLGIERIDFGFPKVTKPNPPTVFIPSVIRQLHRYPTQPNGDWGRVQSKVYSSKNVNPFHQYTHTTNQAKYSSTAGKYPWWSLQRGNGGKEQYHHEQVMQDQRGHRIYPILGKRSNATHFRHRRSGIANDNLTRVDRIHIRHQRRTRHDLYEAIEKYLERKKITGHYCVLRALCETGQKSEDREPGSFVGELMRAVFTLPEPLEDESLGTPLGYKEQQYDAAHAFPADCSDYYHHCEHSIWSSSFVS